MNAIEIRDVRLAYRTMKRVSIKQSLFSMKRAKINVFEALRGISFSVPRGQIVGLIGKNGSGKSTMLRSIAGIFSPNSGTINTFGNTVSLLSLGVGFQNKLTGRENIILSGMLMGFPEKEIRSKLQEIIDFSELGKFIDMPVQTYSSGMYSKLAFSITAILETDIMLVDEVLSVGDAKFKRKSYKRMKTLIMDEDRTVIIVSHSMDTIRKLCSRVIWLDEGKIVMDADTETVAAAYEKVEGTDV